MNESQDKAAMLARIEALELAQKQLEFLAGVQQRGLEMLGEAVKKHQRLLEAVASLEQRRHGQHSSN